ncbi:MAG: hypothetical protein ACOVOQ_09060 [Flavobacterium sp.]|jgi:hypothetical protein
MKTIKITLSIIVVITITFFVIRSFSPTVKPGEIQQSGNPFIDKIQREIKALQLIPENKLCNNCYRELVYHLDDYHKNSKLGKTKLENDQWKDNLSKLLYAAYTDKFIKQAYFVFNHSEWAISDLVFIRKEYQELQNSPILERNSPIDKKFNEIKIVLNKYDEITSFVSSCKSFSFLKTELDIPFPLEDVKNKISVAMRYRNNRLENSYVNICSRLHNELNEIPQTLFRAHVKYLDNLISHWSNSYTDYNTQKVYANAIFIPLKKKIIELDNEVYNITEFNDEFLRLKNKWEKNGENAYDYHNKNEH